MEHDTHPGTRVGNKPPLFNYVISFLLVGVAWGFTTPFIRRAAADFTARQESTPKAEKGNQQSSVQVNEGGTERKRKEDENVHPTPAQQHCAALASWARAKASTLFWTVVNLLRTPAYSIPLAVNLTGSIWFFLLVGEHELSLTVPLANSSAFLFTVLGEWYVERKTITMKTWLGMALVAAGIGICVQVKN